MTPLAFCWKELLAAGDRLAEALKLEAQFARRRRMQEWKFARQAVDQLAVEYGTETESFRNVLGMHA